MSESRYSKLKQKYWYYDNTVGKKKYKREAKTSFGLKKQIWADSYSEWGAKKDDWIALQESIQERGLSENELMSLGAITVEELSAEWIYKVSPTRVKNGTVEKRESNYKNLIMDSPLNKAKIVDIDSRHIKIYFKTLESYSEKSRAKDYLNPLFDYAIEKEIISSNPIPKKVLKAMAQEEKL